MTNTNANSASSPLSFKVLERKSGYRNRQIDNVTTLIPARALVEHFDVAIGEGGDDMKNYQRKPEPARVKKLLGKLIDRGIDLLLSVTLNIREESAFRSVENGTYTYIPATHGSFWVVDGSHRVHALKELYNLIYDADSQLDDIEKSKLKREFEELEVICVVMFSDLKNEIYVFNEINKHSKPVQGNVVIGNIVKSIAENDKELIQDIDGSDEWWKVTGYKIANSLNTDGSSLWYDKILFAGGKASKPNVGINSMIKYLKVIVDSPKASIHKSDTAQYNWILECTNAYWIALSKVYPQCFEDANKYSIQKAIGTDVIMRLWDPICDWALANIEGKPDFTNPDIYIPAFRKISQSLTAESGEGDFVDGHTFWLSGNSGAIGNFAGEKGKKNLFRRMYKILFES